MMVSNFAVVDRTVNYRHCIVSFGFTALHCIQRGIGDRKSDHSCICLPNAWIVTKRTKLLPKFLYRVKGRCI